jgi:hypothetical protein
MEHVMRHRHRGIAYVDVFVSMVVVSLAIVAGLNAFGVFAREGRADRETAIATELAAQLAAEIRGQAFEDSSAPLFGPEVGETDGTRSSFDDVDDYNNWSASPPKRRDGTVMTDYQGYTQEVAVALYGSANQKKITVTIKKDGRTRAEFVLLRSRNDAETQ